MKPERHNEREHAGLGLGTLAGLTLTLWGFMWLCSEAYEFGIHHLSN